MFVALSPKGVPSREPLWALDAIKVFVTYAKGPIL